MTELQELHAAKMRLRQLGDRLEALSRRKIGRDKLVKLRFMLVDQARLDKQLVERYAGERRRRGRPRKKI